MDGLAMMAGRVVDYGGWRAPKLGEFESRRLACAEPIDEKGL